MPGDRVPYEDLSQRLRPYSVTVALLPVEGRPDNFEITEAAHLAQDIGARWLVPMNYDAPGQIGLIDRFIGHLLGHRPAQRFKVFERAEMWSIPV